MHSKVRTDSELNRYSVGLQTRLQTDPEIVSQSMLGVLVNYITVTYQQLQSSHFYITSDFRT
jgi:hypothetical protein